MKKITIIGVGNVGEETAAAIFRSMSCRILLIDRVDGLAEGKAMDIRQSANLVDTCSYLSGSSTLADMTDSELIVISAGSPRKDGMSRLDLLKENKQIILNIGKSIQQYAPKAVILIISNPVDLLTTILKRHFPEFHVFGFGCSLDSYRLRYFIGEKLNVNPSIVTGLMIGTHDPDMIPYFEGISVGGIPVTSLLGASELNTILQQTIAAGNEIVRHLKTTGSFYTAGQIIARMAKSIIEEIPEIFSVDVFLDDFMGIPHLAPSLPAIIGKGGVLKQVPIKWDEHYSSRLKAIAEKMQDNLKE